jgi:FKBP-type peptidyl-prolyl cis-trans isomerase
MKFNKFELVGIGISVLCMATALYLVRVETAFLTTAGSSQLATASLSDSGVVVVSEGGNVEQNRTAAYVEAADNKGNIKKLVIDDIKVGQGAEVKKGDTVEVHYVGTLQNGIQFDSSRSRGETFSFTVGEGRVIAGWEQGLIGMKVGGERVLVIPPELGYGSNPIGPIPANSTLVFMIELISIK